VATTYRDSVTQQDANNKYKELVFEKNNRINQEKNIRFQYRCSQSKFSSNGLYLDKNSEAILTKVHMRTKENLELLW
jgi:hypothetical protein